MCTRSELGACASHCTDCSALKLPHDAGIVTPVTLCMAITVLLVRVLNPEGASNSNTMRLATAYYDEKVRE